MPAVVEARDVRKSFPPREDVPAVEVLHGVSLTVMPGEIVSIVGPSGSGKSTLLYCLAGLEELSSGSVMVAGTELKSLSRPRLAELRRDRMGFIFQSYNLIPSLTAVENVELPARLARRRPARSVSLAALGDVGLGDKGDMRPGSLSGGQQQRVAIARALFTSPDVVFADEPTGALDTTSGELVLDLLRGVADRGRSVLMVTHDLEAAARADRALVMRDGLLHQEIIRPTAKNVFDAVDRAAR